jgi:hypothetical protein
LLGGRERRRPVKMNHVQQRKNKSRVGGGCVLRLIGFIRLIDYCPLMRKTLARRWEAKSGAPPPPHCQDVMCDDVPGGCNFWHFRAGQKEIAKYRL